MIDSWFFVENRPAAVLMRRETCQPVFTIRAVREVDGGYEYLEAELPVGVWNRGAIISAIVRMRYSADDVEAVVNNVLQDPFNADRLREYKALQEWRKKAKIHASELMAYADEHGLVDWDIPEDESHTTEDVEAVPDGVTMLQQGLTLLMSQAESLDDEQAVDVPALFPTWESMIGESVEAGKRLFYGGRLWKVLQAHTIQADWTPDVASSLFTEVAHQQGGGEIGTLDNPIPYNGNMELEEGKYYSQDGVVYRCIRSSGIPLYNPLRDLVGLYVEIVN